MTWTIEDSKIIYGIGSTDLHFLDIDQNGDLMIELEGQYITLKEIIERFGQLKYKESINKVPSFTLRLPQLITSQIRKIVKEFENAMTKYNYTGTFKPLYPIKVNQRKREVHTVLKSDPNYGLEAGTKSELILLLKVVREQKNRIIMCNGVKDRGYIQIVKRALEDGYRIYISIESITELKHIVEFLPKENLNLILRVKPYVNLSGHWSHSSGRNSKFGLSIGNLDKVLTLLKKSGFQDRLFGLHAHPGSQIESQEDYKIYFNFLIEKFIEIKQIGFSEMRIIDFGGGLAIDYDGWLSKNLFEVYADLMIKMVVQVFDENGITHPNIMIEAGRAVTALSSMVVIQPLEFQELFPPVDKNKYSEIIRKYQKELSCDNIQKVKEIWKKWSKFPEFKDLETLHKREMEVGVIKDYLRKRFFHLMKDNIVSDFEDIPELFAGDEFILGNFSVFNGACDFVMVDQYFPIFPISYLDEQPERIIRLVDITCDSDGEISIFTAKPSHKKLFTEDGYPLTSTIRIEWNGIPIGNKKEILDNYIVIGLVGAYQDIIEFDHNLIGDLPDVEIILKDGQWDIEITEQAESIQQLVKEVGYDLDDQRHPYIYIEGDE